MIVIEQGSPAGFVMTMLEDALRLDRLSRTEAEVVYSLLRHPAFPEELRRKSHVVVKPPNIEVAKLRDTEGDGATT